MAQIKAVQVTPTYYVGSTTLADIRGNCPDPKRVDLSTESARKADPDLARAHAQRGANQRQFNKSRITRAVKYARYIQEVDDGTRAGGYPPITLWTKDAVTFDPQTCSIQIAGATILTANDGETQLAARYMLAQEDPAWLDKPFAITLTTESTKEDAMQTLHDMNHYATPVSEKDTAALNIEGPLTKAINIGIERSGRGISRAETIKARGEKVTGQFISTESILLHGAIGALYGKAALERTPASLLKIANDQFHELTTEQSDTVSAFIENVLRLSGESLKTIDSGHMLALGVRFNETRRLMAPLSIFMVETIDAEMKKARGGKRATVHHRAVAFSEKLVA